MLLHFAQTCASSVVLIVSDCAADMAKVEKQKVLECLVLGEKIEYSDQFNLWKSRSYGERLSLLPPRTYLFHGEQFMIYQNINERRIGNLDDWRALRNKHCSHVCVNA